MSYDGVGNAHVQVKELLGLTLRKCSGWSAKPLPSHKAGVQPVPETPEHLNPSIPLFDSSLVTAKHNHD